jgi:hypothetical protein
VYQQQQQQEQQQEQEQQDAENPFLDPPFSRIKTVFSRNFRFFFNLRGLGSRYRWALHWVIYVLFTLVHLALISANEGLVDMRWNDTLVQQVGWRHARFGYIHVDCAFAVWFGIEYMYITFKTCNGLHSRRSSFNTEVEVIYNLPPLDLKVKESALIAAHRVGFQRTWLPTHSLASNMEGASK